jgi:hypothetical protein
MPDLADEPQFNRPKPRRVPIICERPRCRRHAVNHVGLTALCAEHIRTYDEDSGPNLVGTEHVHDYSVPFRGHLMCADDLCGAVATVDLSPLTEAQREAVRAELRAEYGNG